MDKKSTTFSISLQKGTLVSERLKLLNINKIKLRALLKYLSIDATPISLPVN